METYIEMIARFLGDGGIFMYIILTVSILGIAIVVERGFILLFKYNINTRVLWRKVSKFIKEGDIEKARAICKDSNAPLLRILDRGISVSGESEKHIQNAVDEIYLEIIPSIDQRVPYLATLANIATLLGLLGTIQGLIQAFSAVATADPSQKAILLAGGISMALYTTAFGLIVAIPLLAMYTFLQARAHRITDEIDEFSVKLINLLNRSRDGIQTK
ncbi:MAG: MotA/TolQ/ExbB proton channel family protein [Thermodesulfobacteriota bacterium]